VTVNDVYHAPGENILALQGLSGNTHIAGMKGLPGLGLADLQDVHQPFVGTRDRLEFLDTMKLTLERALVVELSAIGISGMHGLKSLSIRRPHHDLHAELLPGISP